MIKDVIPHEIKQLKRGAPVRRLGLMIGALLFCIWTASPSRAADPLAVNPFHGLVRNPFSLEAEVYSGGITGQHLGAAFDSALRGDYGVRLTFGVFNLLNFSASYLYSNQTRTLTEGTPAIGTLPTGTVILRSNNLNMAYGDGELTVLKLPKAQFYISPGIGFARNGARNVSFVTPLGTVSSPIGGGTSLAFNLGAGVKIYPKKHFGFRIDLRDFLSGGGTGSLSGISTPPLPCPTSGCTALSIPTSYLGNIPVNNNLVLTLGLIFKII